MKKVEEFNKTQKLMEEYKNLGDRIPEIDKSVEELNHKIELNNKRLELTIERLNEQMELTFDDVEFEIEKEDIKTATEEKIKREKEFNEKDNNALNKEIDNLNKEKSEKEEDRKYFRTDENLKTITMEIEEIKKEIRKEETELKKKDIELEELYQQDNNENSLKWQEIYKEKDELIENIEQLNNKIEEYTIFMNELKSIELTPEEYKTMYVREQAKIEKQAEKNQPEEQPEEQQEEEQQEEEQQEEEQQEEKDKKVEPINRQPKKKMYEIKVEDSEIDLNDVNVDIRINKEGITVLLPNNEYKFISLNEYKKDWEHAWSKDEINLMLNVELSDEQVKNVDPMIMTAFNEMMWSQNLEIEVKNAIINKYAKAIQGKEVDPGLKSILYYDRTDLDYLKPRNLISRIMNRKQFDKIKQYANFAEKNGMAEIENDKPGKIREFFTNIKNKLPLLSSNEPKLLAEDNKVSRKEIRKDQKALRQASKKYYRGEIDYQGEIATGIKGKINSFKDEIKFLNTNQSEMETELNRIKENKERANAFSSHVSITEQEKDNNER